MRTFAVAACWVLGISFVSVLGAQSPVLDWQLEATPPSRNLFTIVRHEGIDAAVLFGGEVYESMDDTWLWRGQWQRVASPTAPSRRFGAGMTYDSARQRIVLFGGTTRTTTVGETWAFDGTAWTQLSPLQSPSPRWGHAIGYDAARDRVVIKGGWSSYLGGPLADLWEFDGVTWQQRAQGGTDPGWNLGGSQFVYDAARNDLLLVGTAVAAWDGTTWSPRSTAGLPPNASGAVHYDHVGQRVLLFVTTTQAPTLQSVFAYAGAGWAPVASAPLPSDRYVGFADDSARAEAIGLRGSLGSGIDDRSHTFVWSGIGQSGTGWTQVVSGLPPGRRSPAMAYDPQRRRMVLYGGGEGIFTEREIYEAHDRTWSPRTSVSGSGIAGHAMVHDAASGLMWVFGSESGSGGIGTWDGNVYGFLNGSQSLTQRWGNAVAYDTLRQRMVVFGGETASGPTNELWAWNGSAWANITAPGPGARSGVALCYDAGRDRLVAFGGSNAAGTTFFGETWEHDGTTWSQRTPAHAPVARASAVLVYDSHLQRCVLVGGFDAQDRRDTWIWDGVDWTELVTAHLPDTGTGIAGAYDPDRREIVVFGGGTFLGTNPRLNRGELWRLRDVSLATWTRSGIGCDAGSGTLRLEALDPPALDTTVRFELQNTPVQFVVLPLAWIGFDDQQWGGLPLPISLAVLGAPGCFVWADAQVSVPMLPLGSHATGSMYLLYVPAAIGMRLHLQGAVWDFGTSSIATADLLTGVVGAP